MFHFAGRLGRSRFLVGAAIRVALFAATVVGFPFIMFGIGKVTNCSSVGGACGAMALVTSTTLKPVFFLLFVFSLAGISMRRARDAGLAPVLGLVIPALAMADYSYGVYAGAHWSFAFSKGVLSIQFPWFMVSAAVAILGLGLLPPRERTPPATRFAGWTASLATFPRWLLLIAGLVAAGAVITSWGTMGLVVGLAPVTLPTFALYAAVLYGIWGFWQRRNVLTAIILATTLLPFLAYAYAIDSVRTARAAEAATIAAIKTEKLDRVPSVLVAQSRSSTGVFKLLGVHGISEIIADGPYSSEMMSYTGKRKHGAIDLSETEVLPEEYLLLKIRRESSFAQERTVYESAGGPLELRRVAPGRDDLIAVWYRTFNPEPAFPPVLTTAGWFHGNNSATTTAIAQSIRTFFDQSISNAMVAQKTERQPLDTVAQTPTGAAP